MLIGIYGLVFEFMNPGFVLPGVAGAISLLLGLYALQELPLDLAGLALLVLGIVFMSCRSLYPLLWRARVGGLIAFVIGAAMLIDTDIPEYQLSWSVIGVAAAFSAAFLIFIAGASWRAHKGKVLGGAEELIGSEAVVLDWSNGEGHVLAQGERWNARGDGVFVKGEHVKIRLRHGLTLIVKPLLRCRLT